jgi:sodium/bile acid cotransporter 7
VPKLGATGGYIRAEYSIKLPAIIIIFIISGLGLKTKALLSAAGDLRIHFLVQVGTKLRFSDGISHTIYNG